MRAFCRGGAPLALASVQGGSNSLDKTQSRFGSAQRQTSLGGWLALLPLSLAPLLSPSSLSALLRAASSAAVKRRVILQHRWADRLQDRSGTAGKDCFRDVADRLDPVAAIGKADDAARACFQALVAPREGADKKALV